MEACNMNEDDFRIEDLDNLKHMTGSDSRYKKRDWGFRNHFVTGENTTDYPSMLRLEVLGYVTKRASPFGGDDYVFNATEKGLKILKFNIKQINNALGRR